jgi:hypothetical protein
MFCAAARQQRATYVKKCGHVTGSIPPSMRHCIPIALNSPSYCDSGA